MALPVTRCHPSDTVLARVCFGDVASRHVPWSSSQPVSGDNGGSHTFCIADVCCPALQGFAGHAFTPPCLLSFPLLSTHSPGAGLPDVERLARLLEAQRITLAQLCQLYRASAALPRLEDALRCHEVSKHPV